MSGKHVGLMKFLGCGLAVVWGCLAGPGASAQPADAPPAESELSSDYIIGPGDNISVFVWRNPELSTNVEVRPDGRVSIPLVDDVQAVGKTPTQLANDIKVRLSEFVRSPDVTVIMSGFGVGGSQNQVRVVGSGVATPQSIPYREGLTLLDVIIAVGLNEFAAGNRARLIRQSNGQETEQRIRLDRLINRGDMSENIRMAPGDVIVIPQTRL